MAEEAKPEIVQQWLTRWRNELEDKTLQWRVPVSGLVQRVYGDMEIFFAQEGKSTYQIRGRKINMKKSHLVKTIPSDDPMFAEITSLCEAIRKMEKVNPPLQKMIAVLNEKIMGLLPPSSRRLS